MLYPLTNQERCAISLNGLWKFAFVEDDYVPNKPLKMDHWMGVPASYNDIFTTIEKKEYVGKVCYETDVSIPKMALMASWRCRIGAAGNRSKVYVNGECIHTQTGGFLPIDVEIPADIDTFRLSIVLDNRLDYHTLPIGEMKKQHGKDIQITHYDFYNYTGIHRNVILYGLPEKPIKDIIINTTIKNHVAYLDVAVKTDDTYLEITIKDPKGNTISHTYQGKQIVIKDPILWDIGQGNLYTLCVKTTHDYYEETFGIRSIQIERERLYLNDKPIYLQGFGMHEDHLTIGKGNVTALNVRDFELLRWIHANSFRTSHYPYDEEMYRLADLYGILIINEMPAVGMNFWSQEKVFTSDKVNEESKQNYINQFNQLIERDKNHPSVIMYSLANEANTHEEDAYDFFKDIVAHARTITDLPLMIVEWVNAKDNQVAQLFDVIGVNRYIGWYTDFADLKAIPAALKQSLTDYYTQFKKPILLSEFGSDTIAGLHKLPATAFSEEFQLEFIQLYRDVIKNLDFVMGEHVWNFADFQTKQGLTRVDGNKKGVFTRDRQPKMVAHWLRSVWEIKKN